MERERVSVTVVDDYEVVARGVEKVINDSRFPIRVVEFALNKQPRENIDIALVDTFGAGEIHTIPLADLRVGWIDKLVVYTWNTDPYLVQVALSNGVAGYLHKGLPQDHLCQSLMRIHAGETVVDLGGTAPPAALDWPGRTEYGLTPGESEVLALITRGKSNSEIAEACFISINTVKYRIRHLYRKIGVSTRAQAVAWALKHDCDIDVVRKKRQNS